MNIHEKYQLGQRLGSGGMADVFRADLTGAEGFRRPVAIKRLHAGVCSDPAFCTMFVREARLLSELHHPNIVSVHDFEWDRRGRLFLVLELVDGVTLAQLVDGGCLPVPVAVYVMAEVLSGLDHAHARGILHRDVTPHNVLLSWSGEVKLSDFGLAKAVASSVSHGGTLRGKVSYLSPEQLQGLSLDGRSDLFSAGVMLHQMLTGRSPFVGRAERPTMAESIARMLTATVVPPRDLRPEITPELSDVVMRMLERDRERRLGSARDVLEALPVQARGAKGLAELLAERFPHGAREAAPCAAGSHRGRPRHGTAPVTRAPGGAASRRRALGLAGLLVVVLVLAGLAMTRSGRHGTGEPGDEEIAGRAATAAPVPESAPEPATTPARGATAMPQRAPFTHATAAAGASRGPLPDLVDAGAPARTRAATSRPPALAAHTREPRASVRRFEHTPRARAPGRGSAPPPDAAAPALPVEPAAPAAEDRSGPTPARARRYEPGWTEIVPGETISDEIPIQRRERR